MLDYRAQIAALDQLQQQLAATAVSSGVLANAKAQNLADLGQAPAYAQLGALIDHLFVQASSDGEELNLLEAAASLWGHAVTQYNEIGSIRVRLEHALDNPSDPGSADAFNQATYEAQLVAQKLQDIKDDAMALQAQIDPMPHLPPHPRQQSQPAPQWDWGNFRLARRTDAFMRSVHNLANTPATRAFAFGVMSSYAADVVGSAYVSHVVGGPRRAHRYRDRIARNAVGASIGAQYPHAATAAVAKAIATKTTGKKALPPEIKRLLDEALKQTFDLSQHVALPDLDQGYWRMLRQMELLDRFTRPDPPDLPSGSFTAKLFGDPGNPGAPSLLPQTFGSGDDDGSGGGSGGSGGSGGGNSPGSPGVTQGDGKDGSKAGCGIIIAIAIVILLLFVGSFIACCVKWAKGEHCNVWDEFKSAINEIVGGSGDDGGDDSSNMNDPSNPGVNSQQLQAIAGSPQVTELVNFFYQIHTTMWSALDQAYNYLAITGLIYPDGLLSQPRFAQFLAVPANVTRPHRPVANQIHHYHLPPTSPIEHPAETASQFPASAPPAAILAGIPGTALPIAPLLGITLWRQMAQGQHDFPNLDLDADRGFEARCWNVRGSLNHDPVGVEVLAYNQQ